MAHEELVDATATLMDFLESVYVPTRLDLSKDRINQLHWTITILDRWAGRALLLRDLSEDLLRRFLADYRQSGRAGATVNSKRCHLLALWRCAWEEGLLLSPPRARTIRRAKAAPRIPEAWTSAEVGRILAAARVVPSRIDGLAAGDWWVSILLTAYDTGERRKALLSVAPIDLSLSGAWVQFYRTKTGRPRFCPVSAETVAACRMIYDPARILMWPWPYSREWLDQEFRRILRAAQVPFGRQRGGLWHKLRRTSGTLVESNGGDGARHLGNTRAVFELHYRDPRFFGSYLHCLPRPISL